MTENRYYEEQISEILKQLGKRTVDEFQADFYSLVSGAYKRLSEKDIMGTTTYLGVAKQYMVISLLGENEMTNNWENVLLELKKRLEKVIK